MYNYAIRDFKIVEPEFKFPERRLIPNPIGRGYLPYTIDEFGLQVYSLKNKKVLIPNSNSTNGDSYDHYTIYPYCVHSNSIKKRTIRRHQLVAMAFLNHVPNGSNRLSDHIDHVDNDQSNNSRYNLEIVSMKENNRRGHELSGTGSKYGTGISRHGDRYQATISGKNLGRYDTVEEALKVSKEYSDKIDFETLMEKSYLLNETIDQVLIDMINYFMEVEINPTFLLGVDTRRLTLTEEIRGFGRIHKTRFDDHTVEHIKRRLNRLIWNRKIN